MKHHIFVLFLLLLLIISVVHNDEIVNVGTSLYRRRDLIKIWSNQEVIQLQGRMIVEQLLPTKIPDGAVFIKYLKMIINKSEIIDSDTSRKQTMVMVADVMGGYMFGILLPKVKMSYYEGRIGFNVTNYLYEMMQKIKFVLDTDGRGWISSSEAKDRTYQNAVDYNDKDDVFSGHDGHVDDNPCGELYIEPSVGHPVVPVPTFDYDQRPGSLVIPFAVGKRLFSVNSPGTTVNGDRLPLLVRYYKLAVRCTSSSPDQFRNDIRRWIDEVVVPLLGHSRWYPVLAGVSHVIRAVSMDATSTVSNVRRKRIAVTHDSAVSLQPIRRGDGDDDDGWPACDDGPGGRLPNTNVFLFVLWLSLTCTWLSFGILSVHKMIRFVLGPFAYLIR